MQIADGTAQTIHNSVWTNLSEREVSINEVIVVGSDGASVMTGSKIWLKP